MPEVESLDEKQRILGFVYDRLKQHGQAMHYSLLLDEVASKFFADREDLVQAKSRFYTWLNLDSRFTNIGQGCWGLRTAVPQKGGRQVPLLSLMHKSVEYDDSSTRIPGREAQDEEPMGDKELLEEEAASEEQDELDEEIEPIDE